MVMTDNDTKAPPHPALVLFFIGGGLLAMAVGAAFLYVGTHPGAESRHGQPEAFALGILVAAVGLGLLARGVAILRARRPNKRLKLAARVDRE
jgi:hypothetical protein